MTPQTIIKIAIAVNGLYQIKRANDKRKAQHNATMTSLMTPIVKNVLFTPNMVGGKVYTNEAEYHAAFVESFNKIESL